MNFKEFKSYEIHEGIQYLHFFPNGYGVSIVRHNFSYGHERGLWEMAVMKGTEEKHDITYDTPVTNDVMGYLNEDEVNDYVKQVSELPEE
jgi:hypothetical protein